MNFFFAFGRYSLLASMFFWSIFTSFCWKCLLWKILNINFKLVWWNGKIHLITSSYLLVKSKAGDRSQGRPESFFSLATTPRCRGGHYSLPWIAPLYPWSIAEPLGTPNPLDYRLVFLLLKTNSNHLAWIGWSIWISKYQRILYISFSKILICTQSIY